MNLPPNQALFSVRFKENVLGAVYWMRKAEGKAFRAYAGKSVRKVTA
jgi:hypothetical protein